MLGKYVRVKVVKPIGSDDEAGYTYPLNYGTVYGNEEQTAFIMGIHHPVRNFDGRVIAVLSDRKTRSYIWIVAPKSTRFIINDIKQYINLEKDFPSYRIECLYESSCGAVVFRDIRGEVRYLLIKNKRSAHWGFPKGHIENGETKEESISKYKIRDRIEKTFSIFVGTTKDTTTVIQQEEIEDYIWLTYDRALSLLKFENDRNILSSAHAFLNENNYI